MSYNSQPHRGTGVAPLELVIPRRVRNLLVRNLPPGTSLKPHGTLSDGSPLDRKREFIARLRVQIPTVDTELRKTQRRGKRNFDANLVELNRQVKIGDNFHSTSRIRPANSMRKPLDLSSWSMPTSQPSSSRLMALRSGSVATTLPCPPSPTL